MYSDYLTLDEAEALISRVKPILETTRALKREIETIAAGYDYDMVLLEEEKPRLNLLAAKLARKLERLEEMGCYVKDLDVGIVDFLSKFEGRDVFLCWKLGESHICHWHELAEGFASRQPVLDLTQLDLEYFEVPVVRNEN